MTSSITDRNGGFVAGLAMKLPCRVGSTGNLTLSSTQTIDGVAVVSGDRVLVKDQTTGSENGIYVVDTGTWTRDTDFDGARDITKGMVVFVTTGTASPGFWYLSSSGTDIDTDTITWTKASSVLALTSTFSQGLLTSTSTAAFLSALNVSTAAQTVLASTSTGNILTALGVSSFIQTVLDDADSTTAKATLAVPYVNRSYAEFTGSSTLAVIIPADDTVPTSTEGSLILTATITPGSTLNRIRARFQGVAGSSSSNPENIICALFHGASTAAFVSSIVQTAGAPGGNAHQLQNLTLEYEEFAPLTSSISYNLRVGGGAGSIYMNGLQTGRLLGGTSRATLTVEEIRSST